MKKMSETSMREANGGRWKCGYCGKKCATWLGCLLHQNSGRGHWYEVVMNGNKISWCW